MTIDSKDDETRAIRSAAARWTAAVEAADIETLGRLMTEDIVLIHGDGRMVCGREPVMNDFARSFGDLSIHQAVEHEETIVADDWAFDRAKVHTTIKSRQGGDAKEFDSRTVTILRKQSGAGWRVARAIGVIKTSSE